MRSCRVQTSFMSVLKRRGMDSFSDCWSTTCSMACASAGIGFAPPASIDFQAASTSCHSSAANRKEGDTVFLEFGGVYNRYTAPMMRTAHIGKPDDQVRRVTEAVKDCVERIFAAAKPGRTADDVAADLFVTFLSREPTADELKSVRAHVAKADSAATAHRELAWALMMTSEFSLNH